MDTDSLIAAARDVIDTKSVLRFDEPIELASGAMSSVFIDGKAGLAHAEDLRLVCQALAQLVADAGVEWDAVGGLTLGADHLSVGLAMVTDRSWFFVRKEPKGRGTGKQIEGADVGPGVRVLLVEDVVSTGGSMFQAFDVISATGADVVAATTLLDRGDIASQGMAVHGVPFLPLTTYADFDLDPVQLPS